MLKIGYEKLENWLVMAPMAGITDLPFRLLIKRLGAGLVTSEMVSATGLTRGDQRTRAYLRSDPSEKPLAVQIFGSDHEIMARATVKVVSAGANIVDINMGCPVKKVVKTGAGAALLRDISKAEKILKAVRKECLVPLTMKMRAGWSQDQQVATEYVRMAEDCGVDAITLHARYAIQGLSGRADWNLIREAKSVMSIPLIGNGDVYKAKHALEMKAETGCDGVMVGRGALGNPWIFQQARNLERGMKTRAPELKERRDLIMEHFRLMIGHGSGNEKWAARKMRGLLLWYTKGLPCSAGFRGAVGRIKDMDTLVSAMDGYFSELERSGFES
jgi:nifR3 family TIM-barrel protein